MRWAVIDQNNIVVNIVIWDGEKPWSPPEGCRVERSDTLNIGDHA